jgi:mono/diheme cytochrome c family protein
MDVRPLLVAGVTLALCACSERPDATPSETMRKTPRSVRLSMAALHQTGGIPPKWRFTPPTGDVTAGRKTFVELRCHTCHRVQGEAFSTSETTGAGPELTAMGAHHPPEYFAESILNPDAVLVEGPGYIASDGRSVMPAYPHMTLLQLVDLVAYVSSLTAGRSAHVMASVVDTTAKELPAPPPGGGASIFFVQSFDIVPAGLAAFEEWFAAEGKAAFLSFDGVVTVETWVDTARDGAPVSTVVGFRDEAALRRFLDDPRGEALGLKFDEFVGPHGHKVFRTPPVYRAATLSAP